MDRKSLFFVFVLTVVFFLMHQWMDFGKRGGEPLGLAPFKTQVEVTDLNEEARLIPESDYNRFNIVKLYKNPELTDFYSLAIEKGLTYLFLAKETSLPQELYTESPAGLPKRVQEKVVAATRPLELRIKPSKVGDPVLYSLYPLAKFNVTFIPDIGVFTVRLIYFEEGHAYAIDGEIISAERLVINTNPRQNALCLLDNKGVIGPFAYYNKRDSRINWLAEMPKFEAYTITTFPADEELKAEFVEQEFFVIENDYQQLVFSNLNASLAELNLPFRSEKNEQSVVLPIEFDKILENNYPFNDTFPHFSYYIPGEKAGSPIKQQPQVGGYYPLLRRSIIGTGGDTTTRLSPLYYATNIIEEEVGPDAHLYKVTRFEKNLIQFQHLKGNRRITKTYSFPENPDEAPYVFDLEIKIEGDSRGLTMNLGIPDVELISGNFSPAIKYNITRNGKLKTDDIKIPKTPVTYNHLHPNWLSNGNGFFGVIGTPLSKVGTGFEVEPILGQLVPSRLSVIDAQYQRFPADKYPGYNVKIPLKSRPGVTKFRFFAGPYDKRILDRVDNAFIDPHTGLSPDYASAQSYHGFFAFVSQPFAKFLFILLDFFHSITGSWGFSIILLTIALRLMLYPLNNWSLKSTAKMQLISPKVTALQEKYKKDPKRAQLEVMQLYRKEGVNPFGGCLPMLIQLPFLFGMFNLLKSSFALRGASFIPGWIDNLTAPDMLFTWKYPIIFFGNSFHLLPFILGAVMYIQQRMMSKSRAGETSSDQLRQQRFMGNVMTIVFTFLFYHFPSGLNIYWISSSLLGILQQWLITKKLKAVQPKKKQ